MSYKIRYSLVKNSTYVIRIEFEIKYCLFAEFRMNNIKRSIVHFHNFFLVQIKIKRHVNVLFQFGESHFGYFTR